MDGAEDSQSDVEVWLFGACRNGAVWWWLMIGEWVKLESLLAIYDQLGLRQKQTNRNGRNGITFSYHTMFVLYTTKDGSRAIVPQMGSLAIMDPNPASKLLVIQETSGEMRYADPLAHTHMEQQRNNTCTNMWSKWIHHPRTYVLSTVLSISIYQIYWSILFDLPINLFIYIYPSTSFSFTSYGVHAGQRSTKSTSLYIVWSRSSSSLEKILKSSIVSPPFIHVIIYPSILQCKTQIVSDTFWNQQPASLRHWNVGGNLRWKRSP